MPRPPLLLLPPSEGKAPGGRPARRPDSFDGHLAVARGRVLAELARAVEPRVPARRSAVLGVRGELLVRALDATAQLVAGTAPVLPAWQRYTGVVWGALGPGSLTPAERRRVLVPSGLYGITSAADPVADYRLRMAVTLGRLGRLSSFWRPEVTAAVVRRARGRVVVDLLPAEHAASLDMVALRRATRVVRVRFVDADGGRAVGHEAKAVKGRLARVVLDEGLDALGGSTVDGWTAVVDDDLVTVTAPVR